MAYCKKFIILFLILFILFNYSFAFASEVQDVNVSTVTGVVITPNSNFFSSSTNGSTAYFTLETGYIYHISYGGTSSSAVRIATSNDIPAINVTYNYLTQIYGGETYDYIANGTNYLYLDYSWATSAISVTREKIQGQESAITDLVDNVGLNALWGVFGSGIDFVFIIVLVAFGLFIIYKLISGLSKGKSKI